ncbi:hypothetical protein DVK85_00920 [Flavobacterium arcticum]|uniref:DUF4890 domain-containing protein n=1 Tax=Flavobacterium arcticum TaxID=1784713 RepID=A0A345H8F7_9FLAO|nr:hypothetical protein [Flavobacterium arcticum]AXG72867.1 hypothetical protein DVK85_00920 [Flavobacterium arcticum]KAF2510469.1 hypothetical protein E0W72_08285 [Flavobacterium arcticum]
MKKIIALFAMMLAFGYTANAQQRKATAAVQQTSVDETAIKQAGTKDVKALAEFIELSADEKTAFQGLFEYKHRTLADKNLSQERKDILAEQIKLKIEATISSDRVEKLNKNPKLMNILTH